jgi:hypothetical protein
VKTQLHTAGLVERNKRRGVHRRKRPRKPCEGMMLHQDASRFAWLENRPELDLVVQQKPPPFGGGIFAGRAAQPGARPRRRGGGLGAVTPP